MVGDKVKNIAVFASGNGSNFQAIAEAVKKGKLKVNLKLLICDDPGAFVLKRAKKFKVDTFIVNPGDYLSKKGLEDEIIKKLKAQKIGLVVLAGFMRILSPDFVKRFKFRILNIHPALLPSFKGARAIRDAFDYGVKLTGVTVHFVDEKTDHGPIILQAAVKVNQQDSRMSLERKLHLLEHKIYPEAIRLFVENRLSVKGRKVKVSFPTPRPAKE